MAKKFDIERFNQILIEHSQELQAYKITVNEIILSNGVVLATQKDVRLCKRRVMTGDIAWKQHFDQLYNTDAVERLIAEKKCRSLTSINGGNACYNNHKDKIVQNLNSGVPWNKELKGIYPYSHICSDETKKKISVANSGTNNGMFGKKLSQDQRHHKSMIMKEKIMLGEFTPNSNNRNTHWESYYKGKKYRSSWEALYQCLDNDAEYETLRIPYFYDNIHYIYIVDFVNHITKRVIEVKPIELISNKKTQAKINAAKNWCMERNYQFILADKEYLTSNQIPVDLSEFDNNTQGKIRTLYETC